MESETSKMQVKIGAGGIGIIAGALLLLVLFLFARNGDELARYMLLALGICAFLIFGAALVIVAQYVLARIQAQAFMMNARENADLMLAQQRLQNELTGGAFKLGQAQNQYLRQLQNRVGEPGSLIGVDDGLFDDWQGPAYLPAEIEE